MEGNIQDQYCTACYYLEKECNQNITGDYSVAKFMIMLEEMESEGKRQDKEMKKTKTMSGRRPSLPRRR